MNSDQSVSAPQNRQPVPISSTDLQRNFGQVLRRVYRDKAHLVVERDGLPVAVLVPVGDYDALTKTER